MAVQLVLTVIAQDEPGIVETLSQTVSDHGANWLGSRMARLAGEFAGIVEVSVPDIARQGSSFLSHSQVLVAASQFMSSQ